MYEDMTLPLSKKSIPIYSLNEAAKSESIPSSINVLVKFFLNKTTVCDIGKDFINILTASSRLPIGKYIPVRNPIKEPIIVQHAAKALLLFNKDTGNITMAEEHTELTMIINTVDKTCPFIGISP